MLESSIKILLELEMSNPSVLGLVAQELIDIWENVVWLHIVTETWDLGLFMILKFLTLRPLQELKNNICTNKKNYVTRYSQSLQKDNLGINKNALKYKFKL